MNPAGLVVLGFGGHARSVADVALRAGIDRLLFVDEAARPGEGFAGFVAQRHWPELQPGWCAFPASGDAGRRKDLMSAAEARGFEICALLSPSAYVGVEAVVHKGAMIAHRAHIGPGATIGAGAIVNTAAVIDHETQIGEYCHIAVNATVAGRCVIGRGVMIGAGAVVVDNVRVCDGVTVGAGTVVVRNITEPGTYVGSPARRLR